MSEATVKSSSKKYILLRGMHLGYIRESFASGTMIEKNEDGSLTIDGKKFEVNKDLDILLKHGWAEPFTKKKADEIESKRTATKPQTLTKLEDKKKNPMNIVESDQDLMEEINISHTKKAKVIKDEKGKTLEVIKGDEPAEERVARLQREIPKLPIVNDDGTFGREASGPALNSGTIKILTAAEREEKRLAALKKVNERKVLEVQTPEQAAKGETEVMSSNELFDQSTAAPEASVVVESKEVVETPTPVAPVVATEAPKKGRGRPKGSPNKPKVEPTNPTTEAQ